MSWVFDSFGFDSLYQCHLPVWSSHKREAKHFMVHWERCLCPDCTLVWERNLDGGWRYIARIAVPVPDERTCPVCASNLYMQWERPLPVLPETEK